MTHESEITLLHSRLPRKGSPPGCGGGAHVSCGLPTLDIVGEVLERIDDLAVFGDLKVQVRAAAHAGRAGDAHDLALRNICAHADRTG